MIDPRTPVDDYERLALELKGIKDRLDLLEAPTGTSVYQTVSKLQALVSDIQQQLNDYIANGTYNKTQLDSMFATRDSNLNNAVSNLNASKANVSHTHDQSQIGGTWDKGVNNGTGGEVRTGNLYAAQAYNTEITYTRRTAWLGNDGRLGYAPSAVEGKTRIEPADIDIAGILSLAPRSFYYRGAIRRRTALRINEGIDYKPEREVGLLAHEVDEVAPWLVYHDAEGNAEGVEYAMLPVALLAIVRDQERRLRALEGDAG